MQKDSVEQIFLEVAALHLHIILNFLPLLPNKSIHGLSETISIYLIKKPVHAHSL